MIRPSLVEPDTRRVLNTALQHCHKFKKTYEYEVFNMQLFLGFVFICGTIMLYRYKTKLTPAEIHIKNRYDYDMMMQDIHDQQQLSFDARQSHITGAPSWQSELGAPIRFQTENNNTNMFRN